ncbi:hypothetical protein HII12_002093 [Brettanomyces bruxellensis]|uniref:Vacuolar protein sorting-associated protein 9 n=1 Tax=Dekkera bruxellensis TaxID=5007 RepID=A0A8H6BL12_DEKBR|nr:hypothetical protein HII12_002093 [Brettanomyces bruxellensis]
MSNSNNLPQKKAGSFSQRSSSGLIIPSLQTSRPVVGVTNSTLAVASTKSAGNTTKGDEYKGFHQHGKDSPSKDSSLRELFEKYHGSSKSSQSAQSSAVVGGESILNKNSHFPQLLNLPSKGVNVNTEQVRAPSPASNESMFRKNRKKKQDIGTKTYSGAGALLNDEGSGIGDDDDDDDNNNGDNHTHNSVEHKETNEKHSSSIQDTEHVGNSITELNKKPVLTTDTISLNGDSDTDSDAETYGDDLVAVGQQEDIQKEELVIDDVSTLPKEQLVDLSSPSKPLIELDSGDKLVEKENKDADNSRRLSKAALKVPNPPKENHTQESFDFQQFMIQFKSKECGPIHRYLRSFLVQFAQRNWTVDEQIKLIKDFEMFLLDKMREYFPFNTMQSEDDIMNQKEGIEKLIMAKLYSQTFSPVLDSKKLSQENINDRKKDRTYARQVRLYDWVTLRNLDVPTDISADSNFVSLASKELNKVNKYKAPRDKVICILNCCKIIFGLLRQQQKKDGIEENADSFVPMLVCVLFNAKVRFLPSNLMYIERFRNEDFLAGEVSYYVSTLQIACNFVRQISEEQITVDPGEYEKNMADARIRLKQEIEKRKQERAQRLSPLPKKLTDFISQASSGSPSVVLTKSAEIMKQSLSNSLSSFFGEGDGDVTSEVNNRTLAESRNSGHKVASQSTREHQRKNPYKSLVASDKQLEQIKNLSLEEHKQEEETKKRTEDVFEELQSMFPKIDKEIIHDVLATTMNKDGSNIGECVDALLTLGSD